MTMIRVCTSIYACVFTHTPSPSLSLTHIKACIHNAYMYVCMHIRIHVIRYRMYACIHIDTENRRTPRSIANQTEFVKFNSEHVRLRACY
jgi:hypothetical protein